jgi:hypothetical protein
VSGARAAPSGFVRDRPETPFSRILEDFMRAHAAVRAAVFLDAEGECVDYASRAEPFEALVFGATLLNPTKALLAAAGPLAAGELVLWVLETERLDGVVRRVSDEHLLALWLERDGFSARLMRATSSLAELLRREAGIGAPAWEPEGESVEVELREAAGWGYAPRRVHGPGEPAGEVEVLGRWTERGAISAQEAVCFRVRVAGRECTLVHEPALQRWHRR